MQTKENAQAKELKIKDSAKVPSTIDLESMAGQGSEFVTANDQKLPMLKILYANSPVLDDTDGKYIEGAKPGDIYSETSGILWKGKECILLVPCLYINTFNEWKDKGDSPGRPIKIHTDPAIMTETKRGDDNKDRLPNGNYIEDTGNHFVFILDKDYQPVEQALITMKSTQKKKSKTWNTMISTRRRQGKNGMLNPARWSTVYRLCTTKESNSQNSWYGWVVEFDKFLYEDKDKDLNLLKTTQAFYQSAMKSDIFGKVDFAEEQQQAKKIEATPF